MKTLLSVLLVGWLGVAHAQVNNTVYGQDALSSNTTGSGNSAFGLATLINNRGGYSNTAVGEAALQQNWDGIGNTAVGATAIRSIAGNYNIGIGFGAGSMVGYNNATGNDNNIEIGNTGQVRDTGVIRIGTQGTQRWTAIAGIRGVIVKGGQAVVVSSTGQLGVASTKVVPNTASNADVLSLRAEIAALRAEVHALKAKVH